MSAPHPLDLPDFLRVENRVPLTPEQEQRVAELMKVAKPPHDSRFKSPEAEAAYKAQEEARRQEKIKSVTERMARKREGRGKPPTGAVWDTRTSRWVLPGDATTVSQVIRDGRVPAVRSEPTVREIMATLRRKCEATATTATTSTRKEDTMSNVNSNTTMPDYSAMTGKELLAAYNDLAANPRKAPFSSKQEGAVACEKMWKANQIATGNGKAADDEAKKEKAKKLREELVGKKSAEIKKKLPEATPRGQPSPPLKAKMIEEGGKKLEAKSKQPSEGARSKKLAMTIKVITQKNPRREGTDAHRHYEAMTGGITVLQYLEKFKPEDRRTAAQWLSNTVRDGHVEVK